MGIARNIARLIPNGSGLLPNANIEAMAASKLTGTVPDANASSGSVIQVVRVNIEARYNLVSSSFAGIGPTLSITPKDTSSRIFLIWTGSLESGAYTYFTFFRNGTNVSGKTYGITTKSGSTQSWDNMGLSFLDSPNTASAITYQLAFSTVSGTISLNDYGSDNLNQLIAMEIAG